LISSRQFRYFLTIALFISVTCFSAERDLRNVNWGMSKEEVMNNETLTLVEQIDNNLVYFTSVSNLECLLIYEFVNNKLYSANYVFSEEHTTQNQYINDYFTIKGLLEKKYGEPVNYEERWNDSLFKSDPDKRGLAVSVGHLSYLISWETNQTEINLLMYGDNFKISTILFYQSKKLTETAQKQKEEKELDKL